MEWRYLHSDGVGRKEFLRVTTSFTTEIGMACWEKGRLELAEMCLRLHENQLT